MILVNKDECITQCETACALGLFDGVHRGHQMIINKAIGIAKENNIRSAVFTFNTDSVTSKGHDGRIEMLMTDIDKQMHLKSLGADYLFSPSFEDLKNLPPEIFVKDILKGILNCKFAVCGTDFTFGKGALGKAEDLVRIGNKYGISVCVMDQLLCDGGVISSTEIRSAIRNGEIVRANDMLGYNFGFTLEVEHGFERGRTWNFPTINQAIPKGLVLPRFGVYCSKVNINGEWYNSVTNIGIKPSVQVKTKPLAETYIIDYSGDLYGSKIEVRLFEFIRPERIFHKIDDLKAEISRNIQFTIDYFEGLKSKGF